MTFSELLSRFCGLHAVVIGDLMLDEYVYGRATRISQEAPVMVVRQSRVHWVPGGAANVAKNLIAMGARTSVVGMVGEDEAGERLRDALTQANLGSIRLVTDPSRPTTRKTRVVADGAHQVLRIDHEDHTPAGAATEAALVEAALLAIADADVVLLSDYRKGALNRGLITQTIERANALGKPVIANAKPSSLDQYRGATLVSLNQFEAADAAESDDLHEFNERPEGSLDLSLVQSVAAVLRGKSGAEHLLVTLGGDGMSTEDLYAAPVKVEVADTAGAGDTTIATLALGLAAAGYRREVFQLAAQASGTVVQRAGVAVPTAQDLAQIAETRVPD